MGVSKNAPQPYFFSWQSRISRDIQSFYLAQNAEFTPLVERSHFFMSRDFLIPECHYININGRVPPVAHLPNPILQQMRFALPFILLHTDLATEYL